MGTIDTCDDNGQMALSLATAHILSFCLEGVPETDSNHETLKRMLIAILQHPHAPDAISLDGVLKRESQLIRDILTRSTAQDPNSGFFQTLYTVYKLRNRLHLIGTFCSSNEAPDIQNRRRKVLDRIALLTCVFTDRVLTKTLPAN